MKETIANPQIDLKPIIYFHSGESLKQKQKHMFEIQVYCQIRTDRKNSIFY